MEESQHSGAALPAIESSANVEGGVETLLDHARRLLAPFLQANPSSNVEQIAAPKEGIAIVNPWDDDSLIIKVPDATGPFSDALNQLYLPPRFTGVWHRDTKDLEIIWTAYKMGGPSDVDARKFAFRYGNRKYKCEFARSSDRLVILAGGMQPTGSTTTMYRNLQSFMWYATTTAEERKEDRTLSQLIGEPRSFWIRNVDWNEDKVVDIVRHLNFYMTYYDASSPHILVHEPKTQDSAKPRTRYITGEYPGEIRARQLDDNLMHFWAASRSGDPARRFIYCYRIIEHAATLYLDGATKASVRKLLSAPHALNDLDELTELTLGAIQRKNLDARAKHDALIRETVSPVLLWHEMENNMDAYTSPTEFEGGFVTEPLVGKNCCEADFVSTGISAFSKAIWDMRNALSHGRDQRTGTVIAPTTGNFRKLEPWVHLISVAAGEVILYQNVL